jgi:hypothetical protein
LLPADDAISAAIIPPPIVRAIPATQPEAIAEAATEVVAVTAVAEAINAAFRRTTSGILIITRNRAY